jgi:hypothetical protein
MQFGGRVIMRIVIDAPEVDFYNPNADYDNFQRNLGMDDNFDLLDTIIYMMDYGEPDEKGVIKDTHNGITIKLLT